MKTVKLYGALGKEFSREIKLSVKSPAEAIRALCVNFKGFEKYLRDAESKGMRFKVIVGKDNPVGTDELHTPRSGEIRIVPRIIGAGGDGSGQFIIGAILVAASFLIPGTTPFVVGAMNVAFGIGVSLVLGGISQMLFPVPEGKKPKERPENDPNYNFNGPVNTTLQGQPVPICYGRLTVGSAVISAGISIDTIKAGYRIELVERTELISTVNGPNLFVPPVTLNWHRRELIDITMPGNLYNYRFYYYEETLVLI